MTIVIAPDKFKGSLSAVEAAVAIAEGLRDVTPSVEIDICPVADGGEGTVAALVSATKGAFRTERVTGPLAEMRVDAVYGILGDGRTAVIEMAAASGLALLKPEDRNPMHTTTYGTGELLMAAARAGVDRIILGIGGSATVDGGIGCAQACGLPVILDGGEPVSATEPLTGADLPRVVLIKHGRGSAVERSKIVVACDVTNPLFGPNGAAIVYGPQKGASAAEVQELDAALHGLAVRTGKLREAEAPGAGAAGGLGFAMMSFFGATLESGAGMVLEACGLRERLANATLCITGEGRLDESSRHGKAPIAVAGLCRELDVPCLALAGSLGGGAESFREQGILYCERISDSQMPIEESMREAGRLVREAAARVFRRWVAGEFN